LVVWLFGCCCCCCCLQRHCNKQSFQEHFCEERENGFRKFRSVWPGWALQNLSMQGSESEIRVTQTNRGCSRLLCSYLQNICVKLSHPNARLQSQPPIPPCDRRLSHTLELWARLGACESGR
jgi:hypothetical protein